MVRARPRRRRSTTEWIVRGTLALVATALGYVSVASTVGYANRASASESAYRLASWDGRVTAALASHLSGIDGNAVDLPLAGQLAHRALRQDPTAVGAVIALGLVNEQSKHGAAAARLFEYSNTLSRRDLPTQLWKIETAVSRGDIAGALHHYDIALRTSRHAPELLFPVLVSAIADPAIRIALVRTFRAQPAWGPLFIEYAASNSTDPHVTSLLFQDFQRSGIRIASMAQTVLIDTLAGRGAFDDAWLYYRAVRPNSDRRRSRDPRFNAELPVPTLFDWRIADDNAINGSIQRGNDGGLVDFSAPPGVGGKVVQQLQLLPAGRYRLSGRAANLVALGSDSPYWVMTCQDGRELGRIDVPGTGDFAGVFEVPATCPAQTLLLVLRPSDAMGGTTGQIERLEVAPAGRDTVSQRQFRR